MIAGKYRIERLLGEGGMGTVVAATHLMLGTQVALVRPDRRVHLQTIVAGRDYGDRIEVTSGLSEGDAIVSNPGDILREGTEVDPVPANSNVSGH